MTDFADKPLFVLMADSGQGAAETAAQNHLVTSTNSVHRVIAGVQAPNFQDRRRYTGGRRPASRRKVSTAATRRWMACSPLRPSLEKMALTCFSTLSR